MKEFMKEEVRIRKGCMIIRVPTNQPKKTPNPKKQNQTLLRKKSEAVYLYFFDFMNILVHVIQKIILLNWELLCQHLKNNLDLHAAFACTIQKLMSSASLSCSENQDDDSSELIFSKIAWVFW